MVQLAGKESTFQGHRLTNGCRIAAHIESSRYTGDGGWQLYSLLLASETWETDGISSQLRVTMDGISVVEEVSRSDIYIDDEGTNPLGFYIPHSEVAQDVCMKSRFPRLLLRWLMKNPETTTSMIDQSALVGVVNGVLNAKLASVPHILEEAGIIEVSLAEVILEEEEEVQEEAEEEEDEEEVWEEEEEVQEEDEEEEDEEEAWEDGEEEAVDNAATGLSCSPDPEAPQTPRRIPISDTTSRARASAFEALRTPARSPASSVRSQAPATVFTPNTQTEAPTEEDEDYFDQDTPFTDATSSQQPSPAVLRVLRRDEYFTRGPLAAVDLTTLSEAKTAEYSRLLSHVIAAGRRIRFPARGTFDLSPLRRALTNGPGFGSDVRPFSPAQFSTSQIERDVKIGAAGELFVRVVFLSFAGEQYVRQ